MKPAQDAFHRTGMIVLDKVFFDPKGRKLRMLIAFYEKATLVGKDCGLDENDIGDC